MAYYLSKLTLPPFFKTKIRPTTLFYIENFIKDKLVLLLNKFSSPPKPKKKKKEATTIISTNNKYSPQFSCLGLAT